MVELDGEHLTVEQAARIVLKGEQVRPAPQSLAKVEVSYQAMRQLIKSGKRIYGVNTGLGKLSKEIIPSEKMGQLQENLLKSHAVGVGSALPDEISRAALLFRLNSLLLGYSGIRKQIISYLEKLLNHHVYPIIPEKGSVGSSGDLAPLAHMALILIGEGEAKLEERILPGSEILKRLDLAPLSLEPKEGLALINGTQVTLAIGFIGLLRALNILENAQIIAALAFEALGGYIEAFDERLQRCRPHQGQMEVATNMRRLLEGSKLVGKAQDIQDPYTLRCIPQVLGAAADALKFVKEKIGIEMNSATDNPLIFADSNEVISGGNFHGEILALALELLGMAISEIGSFSERRIALLLEAPDLPEFLIEQRGLNCGLMVPQYTAAALASENKVLAHPSAVDSIPTSGGKEDHNSMSAISACKALKIIENVEYILGIELLTAVQALDFRDSFQMAPLTKRAYELCRAQISPLEADRILQGDIEMARQIVKEGRLVRI